MASLKVRFISAAILIPLVVVVILSGGWIYTLLIVGVTLLGSFEYIQMLQHQGHKPAWILVVLISGVWLADAFGVWGQWSLAVLGGVYFVTAIWAFYAYKHDPANTKATVDWALTLAGGTYLGVGSSYCIRLRLLPSGMWWTLVALPTVWAGDTLAYFVGSRWGKHKMFPAISPGKSWEGYVSGVFTTLLVSAGLSLLWVTISKNPTNLTPFKGMVLGGFLGFLTPAGDFFISMIKRETGVKDSGDLIPGHGGMLDRIDSLLWAVFITWVVAQF